MPAFPGLPFGQVQHRPTLRFLTITGVALFAFSALLLSTQLDLRAYDEGLMLYGAEQVTKGKLPYRDFWTLYGPGAFYALGALFDAFGHSVATSRALDLGYKTGIVVASSLVLSRGCRWPLNIFSTGVVLLLLISIQQPGFPIFPAILMSLLALYFLSAPPVGSAWPGLRLLAGGALAGGAVLYRTDLGLYALLACTVALFLAEPGSGPRRLQPERSRWIWAGTGVLLVVVPAAAALACAVPASDLYQDLVRIPVQVYPSVRTLPWPEPDAIWLNPRQPGAFTAVVYAAVIATGCCLAIWATFAFRRGKSGALAIPPLPIALTVLAALCLIKGAIRVEPVHMAPALVASTLAMTTTFAARPAGRPGSCLIIVAAFICMWPLLGPAWRLEKELKLAAKTAMTGTVPTIWTQIADACGRPALARLRCATTTEDRVDTARFLADHTPAGQTVYVGAGRHDKLFMNDVSLYFLSGTSAPTKWHDLHPGLQTTAEIQQEMIADLRRTPPAWVVIDEEWDLIEEPNLGRVSSGVTLLDDYLRDNYALHRTIGPYSLLAPRRPTSPP